MSDIHLVVDNREYKVFSHIDKVFNEGNLFQDRGLITYSKETIEIGDYRVDCGNEILCIIERKSLKDYASSVKDGRHDNKEKLMKLRDETDCDIYYVIEGPMNPNYETLFARMEYKNILASIRHLQIMNRFHIIRTQNKEHTARELRFICEIYSDLHRKGTFVERLSGGGESKESFLAKCKPTQEELLRDQLMRTWISLPGISGVTANELVKRFTLKELIDGIPLDKLDFQINNRNLNKKVRSILSNGINDYTLSLKILSSIKGVSIKTASNVLSQISLVDLTNKDKFDEHVNTKINNKKIGKAKMTKLHEIIYNRDFITVNNSIIED